MIYRDICLSKVEEEAATEWMAQHNAEHDPDEYLGTISGKYTVEFSLTSIGALVSVKCICGASKYLHRDL